MNVGFHPLTSFFLWEPSFLVRHRFPDSVDQLLSNWSPCQSPSIHTNTHTTSLFLPASFSAGVIENVKRVFCDSAMEENMQWILK